MRWTLGILPLALSGCFAYTSVDYTLDVAARRVKIVYCDLRGSDRDDFVSLMKDVSTGDAFHSAFPKATVSRQEVVPNAQTLEVQVDLQGSSPADLGLQPWDKAAPYRFCPPDNLVITATNAAYRDADGCAVWMKGARVLRVHAVPPIPTEGESLLPQFQKWVADGRPDLSAAKEPTAAPAASGAPASPAQ